MTDLTRQEKVELGWMDRANRYGLGLYGPSLGTVGPEPVCEALVSCGLARVERDGAWAGPRARRGYWITDEGREALRHG